MGSLLQKQDGVGQFEASDVDVNVEFHRRYIAATALNKMQDTVLLDDRQWRGRITTVCFEDLELGAGGMLLLLRLTLLERLASVRSVFQPLWGKVSPDDESEIWHFRCTTTILPINLRPRRLNDDGIHDR